MAALMPPSLQSDASWLSSWLRNVTDGNERFCFLLPSLQGGAGHTSTYPLEKSGDATTTKMGPWAVSYVTFGLRKETGLSPHCLMV